MWLVVAAVYAGTLPDLPPSPVVPADSGQILLAIVPDANSSTAIVTRWVRIEGGWSPEGPAVDARIGAKGVAWGRGLHPSQEGLQKKEGDNRAPAGIFSLGLAYGDAPALPAAVRWPYHPVGPRDLWYEDPASPLYNTHVLVPGTEPLTPEQAKATMKRGDPAHALKVFVGHNAAPGAVAGAGSAIFLHSWRKAGALPTAGCTAMARENLDAVVAWMSPEAKPVFALLTAADAERLAASWGLPVGQHCLSWVHGPDSSTDCYPTPARCEAARVESGRESTACRPAERVSCTALLAAEAGSDATRCFGDSGNCERYRAFVSGNGVATSACTAR